MVAGAAPAMAVSKNPFDVQFDGGGGGNGYLNSVYLNLGVAVGAPAPSTLEKPLVITVDVVGLNPNTTRERSFSAGSSDGTVGRTYDAATRTTTLTWTIPLGCRVPTIGSGAANPDILFSFGDGLAGGQRITNKIVVRSISGGQFAKPLPIDSSVQGDVNQRATSPDGIYRSAR